MDFAYLRASAPEKNRIVLILDNILPEYEIGGILENSAKKEAPDPLVLKVRRNLNSGVRDGYIAARAC